MYSQHYESMPTIPYTKLSHEKLSIIITFAYSLAKLRSILDNRFKGEWKYLRKTIEDVGSENSIRAFIELASYLRLLDDQKDLSGFLARVNYSPGAEQLVFGRVIKQDQPDEPLYLRDLTNKIIHAKNWKWDISNADNPKLICISKEPERWQTAEIDIEAVAGFCGGLMH